MRRVVIGILGAAMAATGVAALRRGKGTLRAVAKRRKAPAPKPRYPTVDRFRAIGAF